MQRLLKAVGRCVYFDTPGNVGSGERQNPMPGWDEVWTLGDFAHYIKCRSRGKFRVVFHPGAEPEAEFDAVCKIVFAVGNVVFAVDEIWEFCTPNHLPKPLRRIAFRGRHPGVTLLWAAQRPALVARGLTSVTSRFFVFRIQEDADLDALAGRIPREALAQVASLPDRAYIERDEVMRWKIQK